MPEYDPLQPTPPGPAAPQELTWREIAEVLRRFWARLGEAAIDRGMVFQALAAILLLAGVLRFTGLNWDEHQHLHPDERFLTMVENSLTWPQSLGEYFDTARNPLNPYNHSFGTFVYGLAPVVLVKFVG